MTSAAHTTDAPALRGIALGAHRRFRKALEARSAALKGLTVVDSQTLRTTADKGPSQSSLAMHMAEMAALGAVLERLGPPADVPEANIKSYFNTFRRDIQLQLDTITHELYGKARDFLFVRMSPEDLAKARLVASQAHGRRDGVRFALTQFDEIFGPLCRAGLVT